jgi:hypothetical protein
MRVHEVLLCSVGFLGSLTGQTATWRPEPMLGSRTWHQMVHDPLRDRVVVFGGGLCTQGMRNDTFEWDGKRWTYRQAEVAPERRIFHQMVYDPANEGVLLLYGGVTDHYNNNRWNDQWLWDGQSWHDITVPVMPSQRFAHSMAADPVRKKVVLFGGWASLSGPTFDDTWEWDGKAWTQLSPPASPAGRGGAGLNYCGATGRMLLFGGGSPVQSWIDTTWEWDGLTWQQFSGPTPSPRHLAGMCETPWNGHVFLHGGGFALNDTWDWDGTSWTQLFPAHRPMSREGLQIAPIVSTQQVVLYGGGSTNNPGTDPNDQAGSTWIWKGDDWYRLPEHDPLPLNSSWTPVPEAATRDRLTFLNRRSTGVPGLGYYYDTWVLEGGRFRMLPTTGSPISNEWPQLAAAYHEALGVAVVFTEYYSPYPTTVKATFTWDGSQWTEYPGTHQGLNKRQLTYDPDRQAIVGLHNTTGEIYEWRSPTQGWIVRPGTALPFTGRLQYMLGYDPLRHRLVYAAGYDASAVYDETWEFDGTAWSLVTTGHPVPLNANGTMCFVPEVGGLLATLRTNFGEPEQWIWNGVDWTELVPERKLPYDGDRIPVYDRARGRLQMMLGTLCDSYYRSESPLWTMEFRSLVPDTYHPRLGASVSFAIEQKTEPGSFFGVLLSGDDFPGVPLPGLTRILPLKSDGILSLGLFPGMFGVLDSQGRATARLRIANDPRLLGLDLHAAMVTLRTNGTLGTVSNRVQLDIIR